MADTLLPLLSAIESQPVPSTRARAPARLEGAMDKQSNSIQAQGWNSHTVHARSEPHSTAPRRDMEPLHSTGSPAPYGRACTNCSKAKCRCISRVEGSCERCHRLGKECTPSVYIRKRTAKRAGVSRTAQLEEKLDDLVSLLKTQAAAKASDAQTALAHPPPIELYTPVSQQSEESTNGESDRRRALSPDPCAEMAMGTPASILSILPCPGEPTPFQAEQYLNTYRAHMARYLPFTHILPTTTSEELRRQSPFLWLCIMCVACGSTSQQTVLAESVKQIVAKKMVVEGEKSLDLLLGVLIFIGWAHFYRKERPFLCLFSSIAISLVNDLNLNLNKLQVDSSVLFCIRTATFSKQSHVQKDRTMDERRAVLGCFLLSSGYSAVLKKLNTLRWTPHMDDCLLVLEERPESASDSILVGLVKLQLIVDRIVQAPWQTAELSGAGMSRGPPALYMDSLVMQLKRIRTELPPKLRDDEVFLGHYYSTELTIYEACLAKSPSPSHDPDFQRFSTLHACLQAIEKSFALLFSCPKSVFAELSFPCYGQFLHCLISLYKLTALEEPAWGRNFVRNTIDLFTVCDQLTSGFEYAASQYRGDCPEQYIFVRCVKVMHFLKKGWALELGEADRGTGTGGNVGPSSGGESFADADSSVDVVDPFSELSEDAWLADIFTAWD